MMAVLAAAVFFLFRRFRERIDRMDRAKYRRMIAVCFLLFTGLLMAAGYLLTQNLIMDLKVVFESLPDLLDNGKMGEYNGYYIVCNNNVGLLLLLGGLFRVLSIFGIAPNTDAGVTAAILFNALMIALAIYFLYGSAKLLFKNQSIPFLVAVLCFLFPVFYLFTPIFYTDTLSMPFLTGALYLYLTAREKAGFKKRFLFVMASSAVAFLGFAIKGSVGVLLVAIAIHLVLEHKGGFLQSIATALAAIVLFVGMYGGYSVWQRKSGVFDFSIEQEVGLPVGLWFLYGSHAPGHYSEEDLQYCISFDTLEQRAEAVNQKILENYRSYNLFSYIGMTTEKAVLTWGDGKFSADAGQQRCLHLRRNLRRDPFG